MRLPRLKAIRESEKTITAFKGYNHRLRIGEDEWYDMRNMTTDKYPTTSTMLPLRMYRDVAVSDMFDYNGLCYLKKNDAGYAAIHCRGVDLVLVKGKEKEKVVYTGNQYVVLIANNAIVMPNKIWVNLENGEMGDVDASGSVDSIATRNTDIKGNVLDAAPVHVGKDKPTASKDGEYWVDSENYDIPLVRKWYANTESWEVVDTYVSIEVGRDCPLVAGDVIEAEKVYATNETEKYCLYIPANPLIHAVWDSPQSEYKYIVVSGVALRNNGSVPNQERKYSWSRSMPDMDFVIECGNRLWGCKYTVDDSAEQTDYINEIYCSKLGDFKNWNSFQGISTDSYRASIGASGKFTGAIKYQDRPVFFKGNCMIEVYGNYPSSYRITTTECPGVGYSSHKTAAIADGILYYASVDGKVYAYNGSYPNVVSDDLGAEKYGYVGECGCGHNGKYYYSCQMDGDYRLFVYDHRLNMWSRMDDDLGIGNMCSADGTLYLTTGGAIYSFGDLHTETQWMLQTGEIGATIPDAKYITGIVVKIMMDEGSEARFYTRYDGVGDWDQLYHVESSEKRFITLPLRPRRCDFIQLRMDGKGMVQVYSITYRYAVGGDLR